MTRKKIENRFQIITQRSSDPDKMPAQDVLLPKYVSDSCYASICRIYQEAFTLSPKSTASMKWASLGGMELNPNFQRAMGRGWFDLRRSERKMEATMWKRSKHFQKNDKFRASWHEGDKRPYVNRVEFSIKF